MLYFAFLLTILATRIGMLRMSLRSRILGFFLPMCLGYIGSLAMMLIILILVGVPSLIFDILFDLRMPDKTFDEIGNNIFWLTFNYIIAITALDPDTEI